jgi:hypothetical protein
MLPSFPPGIETFVLEVTLPDSAVAGSIIITLAVAVQLFPSATVTIYVPAASPVAVTDV